MAKSKLKLKVSKIVFIAENSDYRIIKANVMKNYNRRLKLPKKISIKGHFPIIYEGDIIEGDFEVISNNYGEATLKCIKDNIEVIKPTDKTSYIKFLMTRASISKPLAIKLFDEYQFDTISKILESQQNITNVGITKNKAKQIYTNISNQEVLEQLCIYIKSLNLPIKYAFQIFEKYEGLSLRVIQENPYQICYDGEISFKLAEIIGMKEGIEQNNPKRIKSAILAFMRYVCEGNGHICYPIGEIKRAKQLNDFCDFLGVVRENNIKKPNISVALSELIEDSRIIRDGDYLYLPQYFYMEKSIIQNIEGLYNWIPPFCTDKDIDDFLDMYEKTNYKLDIHQKEAVYKAILGRERNGKSNSCRMSIITGGPGTGKTSTTNVITECILAISRKKNEQTNIELCAPSGKAAQRMVEVSSTMTESSTIHRKYKIGPANNKKIDLSNIDDDFVFIDEASMIDIEMLCEILKKTPETTRIILSGDVDQLPSVGPGQILRDLINSGIIPTTKLTTIFRQAQNSDIVKVAHGVNNGESLEDLGLPYAKGTNFVYWETNTSKTIQDNLLKSVDHLMQNYNYNLNDISILSPMRKGDIGVNECNQILQEKFSPHKSIIEEFMYENLITGETITFRKGDKVIHIKNNYNLSGIDTGTGEEVMGVFNGFVGEVLKIYEEYVNGSPVKKMDVLYESQEMVVTYDNKTIEELELAYAITVHKSQGSEYPVVIMPIHSSQKILLNRNLLYTAITRAKKMFILVGSREAIQYAIDNIDDNKRYSLLADKLKYIA